MKSEGHPKPTPSAFRTFRAVSQFLTRSTMKSGRTEKIDGVEYHVVIRDVTADTHPAYTGEKRFVDTAGRVERFQSKFKRAAK
jgi:large subunit ribosomal protein L31